MPEPLLDPPHSYTELLRGPVPPTPEQIAAVEKMYADLRADQ